MQAPHYSSFAWAVVGAAGCRRVVGGLYETRQLRLVRLNCRAMPDVIFILPDGERRRHSTLHDRDTIMDVALDNGVPGIIAQCGGGCTCSTCHCWVQADWLPRLPAPHPDESDLLEYVWGRTAASRLSCQIEVDEALDGIEVRIPEQQA